MSANTGQPNCQNLPESARIEQDWAVACVSWQLEKCSSKYFLKSFPTLDIYGLAWLGCGTGPGYRYTICQGPFKRSEMPTNYLSLWMHLKVIILFLSWQITLLNDDIYMYIWKLPTFSTVCLIQCYVFLIMGLLIWFSFTRRLYLLSSGARKFDMKDI